MKCGYRVSIRGEIPPDLQERISALHATAICQPAGMPKKSRKTEKNLPGNRRPMSRRSPMATVNPPPRVGVATAQRHSPALPCRVCGGHSRLPKGRGVRCYGFLSSDGRFANCTRTEYGGQLQETGAGTFAHFVDGACKCGQQHRSAPVPLSYTKPVLDLERMEAARRIWARTRCGSGTIVETYLQARGLTLPIPPALRWRNGSGC